MLGPSELPTRIAATLLFAATFLVACDKVIIPPSEQDELHRSNSQSLVVRNSTFRTVYVIPANPNDPRVEIPPRSHREIEFVVVTNAERGLDGVLIAGSQYNKVVPIGGARYLTSRGLDWVLTVGPAEEPLEHDLVFGDCWFSGPAASKTHYLDVEAPSPRWQQIEICP